MKMGLNFKDCGCKPAADSCPIISIVHIISTNVCREILFLLAVQHAIPVQCAALQGFILSCVHHPPQLWRQVLRVKLRCAIAHCKAIDTVASRGPAAGPGGAAGALGDDAGADADDQPAAAGAAGAAIG